MSELDIALQEFNYHKSNDTDINEHMETLKKYASDSWHITELGVRKIVSTWAFVAGLPRILVCVDIVSPSDYRQDGGAGLRTLEHICEALEIDFDFILGDTLKIELEETDLLFIDTLHTYAQLKQELTLHGNKSKRWIIMHDTQSCGEYITVSDGKQEGGLNYAIGEFLQENPHWKIKEVFINNNGLTVLERTNDKSTGN